MKAKQKAITDAQWAMLEKLSIVAFRFAGRGERGSCEALESRGLADSQLMIKTRNNATGMTHFTRAYRLNASGKEALEHRKEQG